MKGRKDGNEARGSLSEGRMCSRGGGVKSGRMGGVGSDVIPRRE